jgi:NAD(P)-dependent dehydrogenase (short-subunit alcohol dehydrogenase family)
MDNQKVWFITGASKGFGLALTKLLLSKGHKVAATSRNKESIQKELGEGLSNLLPLTVNLIDEASVKSALEQTVKRFGKIDVVVNNAGYMLLGSLEEVSAAEFSQSMNVNVFAFLHVIRNVMPYFRSQQSGHIINFSSSAGYGGDASAGSYNAVKAAIIGFSEALALEVAPFNTKVTIVSPGLFRTSLLENGAFAVAEKKIEGYPTSQLTEAMNNFNGKQPGDPKKLVAALLDISEMDHPPLHLLLGEDSFKRVHTYYSERKTTIENWKQLSLSMSFE